ncbi:hypothetical protein SLEP1_g24842 [Rubroshorea leprosula]|uniref:Uncharacterized protein n=1 Tax=Rubroshorea leprosula TaxID=152421 RepID=A0AAV5JP71_9ROSI|nr:hypothetical protein SLEP1_g24842 [Rubroshorea leprosula]
MDIHEHIHAYMHAHMGIHACTHGHSCMHTWAFIHACIKAFIHTCICMHSSVHDSVYPSDVYLSRIGFHLLVGLLIGFPALLCLMSAGP